MPGPRKAIHPYTLPAQIHTGKLLINHGADKNKRPRRPRSRGVQSRRANSKQILPSEGNRSREAPAYINSIGHRASVPVNPTWARDFTALIRGRL
jgi:hypothetical protein